MDIKTCLYVNNFTQESLANEEVPVDYNNQNFGRQINSSKNISIYIYIYMLASSLGFNRKTNQAKLIKSIISDYSKVEFEQKFSITLSFSL